MIKKKVEVGGPLTNSELILMNILWDAQRPITGPEILAYVNASPEGPAFARTSYHAMVNNLLDKNYIISISGVACSCFSFFIFDRGGTYWS